MSNKQTSAAAFTTLSGERRREIVKLQRGFLADARARLAAGGMAVSAATVCRTWYSKFDAPNPAVVTALQAAYQRYDDRTRQARARVRRAA